MDGNQLYEGAMPAVKPSRLSSLPVILKTSRVRFTSNNCITVLKPPPTISLQYIENSYQLLPGEDITNKMLGKAIKLFDENYRI